MRLPCVVGQSPTCALALFTCGSVAGEISEEGDEAHCKTICRTRNYACYNTLSYARSEKVKYLDGHDGPQFQGCRS